MAVAARMTPDWKQWVGEIVAGEFPLEQFLGANERGAVFRTQSASGVCAIKLIAATGADADRLVEQWNRAAALSHPHLMRIEKSGRWNKSGMSLVFAVMDYGDENLAAVLNERALTGEETLDMLRPLADALAFLHSQGLAHGRLKAGNVFAVNDTLKIAADSVAPGEASQDLRALGDVVTHALTQSARGNPSRLPQPFQEIVYHCGGTTGREPWTAAELAGKLRFPAKIAPAIPGAAAGRSRRSAVTYSIAAFAVLVIVAIVGSLIRNRPAQPVAIVTSAAASPTTASAAPSAPVKPTSTSKATKTADPAAESAIDTAAPEKQAPRGAVVDAQQIVAKQVMPEISAHVRGTVHGTVVLLIKVAVDESGNVMDASLEPTRSRYLGKLAVAAAKNWRFVPASGAGTRDLVLRFEVTKNDTNVFVEKPGH
jgi:TonB family protein